MFIPDLTRFSADHPPSPYNFPLPCKRNDRWGVGQLPPGAVLCAVGWLGASVPATGQTPDPCIDTLFNAYGRHATFTDGTAGWHDCEMCSAPEAWYPDGQVGPIIQWRKQPLRLYGHGHHLIRFQDTVYMCPALILHYILDHDYRPPDEFLQALPQAVFLTHDDLVWVEYSASN